MNTQINFRAVGLVSMTIALALNLISPTSALNVLVTYHINLLLMIMGISLLFYSSITSYKKYKAQKAECLAELKQTIEPECNQLN